MPVGLNSFDHARFGVIIEVLVYRYIPEELIVSLTRVVQEQFKNHDDWDTKLFRKLGYTYINTFKKHKIKLAMTCNKNEEQLDAKNNAVL